MKTRLFNLLAVLALSTGIVNGGTQVDPETATAMLRSQDRQLERNIVKVTDNVYTAVGFHGANTSR